MTRIASVVFIISLLTPTLVWAQDIINPEAPLYVRYCGRDQDDALRATMDDVTLQLQAIEELLESFQSLTLTYLEATTLTENAVATWNETTLTDCLVPLTNDMNQAFNGILLAMLYGQLSSNPEDVNTRLDASSDLIDTIEQGIIQSRAYLNTPPPSITAPPPQTNATEANPASSNLADPSDPNALANTLQAELLNRDVVVLRGVSVQEETDGGYLISIQLDRFLSGEQDFDAENTLFTFDRVAQITRDWSIIDQVSRIVIDTYDGENRTYYAESTGDNFRAYYFDNTLDQVGFNGALFINDLDTPSSSLDINLLPANLTPTPGS